MVFHKYFVLVISDNGEADIRLTYLAILFSAVIIPVSSPFVAP